MYVYNCGGSGKSGGLLQEGEGHGTHGNLLSYSFRGSFGLLNVLERYPVIFSLIGAFAMAADAPDHHKGDLGRPEEVRNGLIGTNTFGHWESIW